MYYFNSPVGMLKIVQEDNFITQISFADGAAETGAETPCIKKAKEQLELYFQGKLKQFDLPLNPKGTDFQKKVWKALQTIPYGETVSYKEIAQAVGSPKAYRAVGSANNKNPIVIVVPCHRVIGSNNKLVGYAGGLDIKQQLLTMEQKYK